MDKYLETISIWNKLADLYQEKFMNLNLYDPSYDFICKSINDRSLSLLDIGCGPGNVCKYILERCSNINVTGIDSAERMIELARLNVKQANFMVLDMRDLDKLAMRFDIVIAAFCLPYLSDEDVLNWLEKVYNAMQPEGYFYLSFVEGDKIHSGYKKGSTGDEIYFHYFRKELLMERLVLLNFEHLKTFEFEYKIKDRQTETHVALILKKN